MLLAAFAALPVTRQVEAQESLADLPAYREGCQALADERFETAAVKFRECWDLVLTSDSGGPEADFVASRLLEALVRDGDSEAAVAWVDGHPGFQASPLTSYWIARALQSEERFAEASDAYQIHLSAAEEPAQSTRINRAVCLSRSGQASAALDLVSEITPTTPEETLRLAQIAAAASRPEEAIDLIGTLTDPPNIERTLLGSLTKLRAALLLERGNRDEAAIALTSLVASSPDSESARRSLLLFEALLGDDIPEAAAASLKELEDSPSFPGREALQLFRILFFTPDASRDSALRAFADATDDPVLRIEAKFRLGLATPEGNGESSIPRDLQERIGFSLASADYLESRFEEAAERFATLAGRLDGEEADDQLFNAALSALRANDPGLFSSIEESLVHRNPRSPRLASLGYLGGLYFAATGDPTAFDRLNRFVQENPGHPFHIEARLALAEIHLNQAPPRPREAREVFEALGSLPLTLTQSERLDYLGVWIERIDGNSTALLQRAETFVSNWPGSAYLGEMLMILATEHYRQKNLAAASSAFARIATEFPDSALAGAARFFAAKSAPDFDEAVSRWRELIAAHDGLSNEATHELALLLLTHDRFQEARDELAKLRDHLAPELDLRYAVMADLGYAFYLEALARGKDPELLTQAAEHFATLSNQPGVPARWRYNAAVRRGKCLEALGKPAIALEIYRSMIKETSVSTGGTNPLQPGETEWLFRAGFSAIEILNSEKNWAAAIEIADALADKSGPRAIEATRLAERLRLRHWVWD
ncbi:MAG: hypothetical protein KDN18_03095 [Verrucomicrobiae bacterium]|nr:hypothetical protein [Verrucomicrobiae bacterium]